MKKIRIVSPAKHIEKEHITFASQFLTEKGFKVEVGQYALGQYNYFSGTIKERTSDFQAALDDESVDIILCARGGYGCVQLLDFLDFTAFINKPKLIVGYSDVTVFHNHISRLFNIPTLHATAPLNFRENTAESLASFINVLNEQPNQYDIKPEPLNIIGEYSGIVTGGNLAILCTLLGTDSDADYQDKILFIEEIGEAIYAVDRMLFSLKKAGKLNQIKGLIVGGMTSMKDSEIPFGSSVEEVIYSHVKSLNIPVCFGFPAGHIEDNRALVIGKKATLNVSPSNVTFFQ